MFMGGTIASNRFAILSFYAQYSIGSNWIPADNFLTTISDKRYRDWLTLLRDGNQNMVRLWGGGVYEPDVFYDICDGESRAFEFWLDLGTDNYTELGILVWQDFQFACGVYPAHDSFVENVKKEAEDNVRRLAHHPSLACLCGNNEDYQMVLQWGGAFICLTTVFLHKSTYQS